MEPEQLTMEPVTAVVGSATPTPPSKVPIQSYREAVNTLVNTVYRATGLLGHYGIPEIERIVDQLRQANDAVRSAPTPGFGPAHNGREISRNAALMNKPKAGSQRDRVLLVIETMCDPTMSDPDRMGITDESIESITGMKHQTASARRRELVIGGFVKDSGRTEQNSSGAQATLWVLA